MTGLAQQFQEIAYRYPDRLAIKSDQSVCTYRELEQITNRLAHSIFGTVSGEPRVGLLLEHGLPMAIGSVACLKAGLTYVPIEPTTPIARQDQILNDAGAELIVADGRSVSLATKSVPVLTIEESHAGDPEALSETNQSEDRDAFILYTSGSTGTPKGVVYKESFVTARVLLENRLGVGPNDRIGVLSGAGMNMFRALWRGAAIISRNLRLAGTQHLAEWLETERITIYHSVPTIFRAMMATLTERLATPDLRIVNLTGETVLRQDVESFRKYFPENCVLINGLGTTEAGTFCQMRIDSKTRIDGRIVSVGHAVEGAEILLLDEEGRSINGSAIGEIAVSSDHLARYWRQPERERFLPDPRGGSKRIYRTGDFGRFLEDGSLIHLGREDFQVKIRGYRVEVFEIESALLDHPEICAAAVVGERQIDGNYRLVAHLVTKNDRAPSSREMRSFLRGLLPEYMIPVTFVIAERLPLTRDGKVDRKALLDERLAADSFEMPRARASKATEPASATSVARASTGDSILELFDLQVAQQPEAIAFLHEGKSISFATLAERADGIASGLRARGIAGGEIVGIFLDRSKDFAASMLGVLRAGCACLPLEKSYPDARLAFMLQHSGAKLVISDRSLWPRFANLDGVAMLDIDSIADRNQAVARSANQAARDDLAFVIYTSGSTGTPKGVAMPQRAILNRLRWNWQACPFEPGEVSCQKNSVGFVDCLWEWLGALLQGIPTAILSDEEARSPEAMVDALERYQVSRILLVPSLLAYLLERSPRLGERLTKLKFWVAAGEPLRAKTAQAFRRTLPNATLWNLYGATEAWEATFEIVGAEIDDSPIAPIGRPITNMHAYILDADRKPVSPNTPGEIYLAGDGLARGYIHDPDLTAERFFIDAAVPGGRLYRTGDLGRLRADGKLEHLGRADRQLKIRGVRIEPGEIEAVLLRHPTVREAVIEAQGDTADRLVAYVVFEKNLTATQRALIAFMGTTLPPSMVPRVFVFLSAMPHNAHGKIDRSALSQLQSIEKPERSEYAAPAGDFRQALSAIFAEVLGVEQVGADDDFFDLGGDSLQAASLLAGVEEITGRYVPIETLLEIPTVGQLAARIADENWRPPAGSIVEINARGPRPSTFGIAGIYGHAVSILLIGRAMGAAYPVYGLQPPAMDWASLGCNRIEEMAAHYMSEVVRVQPSGPYHLIGASFGGVMAFEIALQLQASGREVVLLAMVDSEPPGKALEQVQPSGFEAGGDEERIAQSGVRVAHQHLRAWADYLPKSQFRGAIDYLLCTNAGYPNLRNARFQWESLASEGMRIIPVLGQHGAVHEEPLLSEIARTLTTRLSGSMVPSYTLGSYRGAFFNYRIAREGESAEFLETPLGHRVAVRSQPETGNWTLHLQEADRIHLYGWAVDPVAAKPSELILVFFRGKLSHVSPVGIPRTDVAQYFGKPDLKNSGYTCEVPLDDEPSPERSEIRVLSLRDDRAYELPHLSIAE